MRSLSRRETYKPMPLPTCGLRDRGLVLPKALAGPRIGMIGTVLVKTPTTPNGTRALAPVDHTSQLQLPPRRGLHIVIERVLAPQTRARPGWGKASRSRCSKNNHPVCPIKNLSG